MKASVRIIVLIFIIVLFDLLTKFLVIKFDLANVSLNSGFIFGFGQIPASFWSLILFALAIIGLGLYFRKTLNFEKINNWLGISFLLGGAIANLIDRMIDYRVVDFIPIPALTKFNLADVCIVLGVILLIVEQFSSRRANRDEAKNRSY